jgi:hypothetical protein
MVVDMETDRDTAQSQARFVWMGTDWDRDTVQERGRLAWMGADKEYCSIGVLGRGIY